MAEPTRVSIRQQSDPNRVSINNQQRQTIRAVGLAPNVLAGGVTQLAQLTDVTTTGVVDGDTLVYDQATGKFVAQSINIDGGTF